MAFFFSRSPLALTDLTITNPTICKQHWEPSSSAVTDRARAQLNRPVAGPAWSSEWVTWPPLCISASKQLFALQNSLLWNPLPSCHNHQPRDTAGGRLERRLHLQCEGRHKKHVSVNGNVSQQKSRKEQPKQFSIWELGNWDSFQTYSWNVQSLTQCYLISQLALHTQYLEFLPPIWDPLLLTESLANFVCGKLKEL